MEVFSTKDIAKAAKEGDAVSKSAFERAGDYLGIALANYLHIFNPSCIVLGGGVIQTGDLILQPMRESLKKHILGKVYEINLTITAAELGDDAGLLGALAFIKIKKKK
jgi:glucokinase